MSPSELYVLARYQESLEPWVELLGDRRVWVYNKGPPIQAPLPATWKVLQLPNVGMCDHTYLYHIVRNWDSLDELTKFLPASAFNDNEKREKLWSILEASDTRLVLSPHSNILLWHFQKSFYTPRTPVNQTVESKLCLATERPFSNWFKKNIGLPFRGLSYGGLISASKRDIQKREQGLYERLLKQVSACNNPEVAHYIERSWISILDPATTTVGSVFWTTVFCVGVAFLLGFLLVGKRARWFFLLWGAVSYVYTIN